jgi:hypothetical protein
LASGGAETIVASQSDVADCEDNVDSFGIGVGVGVEHLEAVGDLHGGAP